MYKFGLGDVVAFNKSTKSYRGEIARIGYIDGKMVYYIETENKFVKVPENARGIVVYKFKKGQSVLSFHYNDNMRSSTHETGVFVRYLSEKIALVKFGVSTKEVRTDGLEINPLGVYFVGSGLTRKPFEIAVKKGLHFTSVKLNFYCEVASISLNHNGNLMVSDHDADYIIKECITPHIESAGSVYLTKTIK